MAHHWTNEAGLANPSRSSFQAVTIQDWGIPQEGFANPHGTEALVLVVAVIVPTTLTQDLTHSGLPLLLTSSPLPLPPGSQEVGSPALPPPTYFCLMQPRSN